MKTMLIITGSLAFDQILNLPGKFADYILPDKIHQLNVSFTTDNHKKGFGGTAGNQVYSLALLGEKPILLASAGGDFLPYKKFLKKHGIDTSYIKIFPEQNTATGFSITDLTDNQIWGFSKGAMKEAKTLKIKNEKLKKVMRSLSLSWTDLFVMIAPNEPQAIENYLDECIGLKIPFGFDPAFYVPVLSPEVLRKGFENARIIFGNDYEISLLAKRLKMSEEKFISEIGQNQIVIETLGEKGSVIYNGGKKIKITPAKTEKIVDPTGAGDAYRSGFLAGFLRKMPLKICGQIGSVTASFAIENYGTINHYFTKKEFEKRYLKSYGREINW